MGNWSDPSLISLRDAGAVSSAEANRHEECTTLTYRMRFDWHKTMRTGCFIRTAIGLYDPASSRIIPNGTDEAQILELRGRPVALKSVPGTNTVGLIDGATIHTTYLHLYTNDMPLPDNGTAKELSSLPSAVVTGPSGQPLPVNAKAMAFSSDGQWLVTEVPAHSLVRVNLQDFSVHPFDSSYYGSGSPFTVRGAEMAVTETGRYIAAYSFYHTTFKMYDLSNCLPTSQIEPLAPRQCAQHDYLPHLSRQIPGLTHISAVHFLGEELLSFTAHTSAGANKYLLSPNGSITSLIPYLGLGDSYASGQGAWNYLEGTDTSTNHCHLSAHSYPMRLSGTLFSGAGRSVACSGARMRDIKNSSPEYHGQNSEGRSARSRRADGSYAKILEAYGAGYLAQEAFVTKSQPRIITVQIGGNDVGFGGLLLQCVSPLTSLKPPVLNDNDCFDSYEDRLEVIHTINRHYEQWVELYRHLQKQAPMSTVFAIGYPQVAKENGTCGLNVRLSAGDIAFSRHIITYLNGVIERAARAAGVHYIDIADSLAGHELCDSGQAGMNGLTAGNDSWRVMGQESFHPTAYGHELIEKVILEKTERFTETNKTQAPTESPIDTPSDDHPLLQAPHSGRPIRIVFRVEGTAVLDDAGAKLSIQLRGSAYGLTPGAAYSIYVGPSLLGSLSADSHGNIDSALPLLNNAPQGIQAITISGANAHGNALAVTDVVYIPVFQDDIDGDGLANAIDACPAVANSLVDMDRDAIDDACDSAIGGDVTIRFGMRTRIRYK
ncbi:MAG TPA: SGNH/GDSL hydrolase family protein [Candidatus Saccharimonadales bacterium]